MRLDNSRQAATLEARPPARSSRNAPASAIFKPETAETKLCQRPRAACEAQRLRHNGDETLSGQQRGGNDMAKLFANLGLVLIVGVVLAVLIAVFPDSGYRPPTGDLVNGVLQWLHVFFGITWIGLLYYFNFVQTPVMPSVPAELKPGVSRYIAPKALFYFRWGAAFTVLTGLLLAWSYGELVEALTLREPARLIGIGMWLALIMAFNVWVIIWPNQKKVLGIVAADDATKAKAAASAGIASRINTLLSIPMLLAMTNAH
jgi:uncharacterized membrane protein